METSKRLVIISLTLGFITLVSLLFTALALSDIYTNNEPNLNMEWNIVRINFLFMLMFIAISSITILKIRKK